MKFAVLVLWITALVSHAQETHDTSKWHVMDRLCGRLVHAEQKRALDGGVAPTEKQRSLSKVPLEIYEWKDGTPCCEGLKMAGSVVTGWRGSFEFKKAPPGLYWVVARWNDKQYQLQVKFAPDRKSRTECLEQGFQIDSQGRLDEWITVTVD